jgi:ABC-type Na+ efflux pump permease subunit
MTGFWIGIVVLVLVVVGVSVIVGLTMKPARKHKLSREEMLALKTSGALDSRKSGMS